MLHNEVPCIHPKWLPVLQTVRKNPGSLNFFFFSATMVVLKYYIKEVELRYKIYFFNVWTWIVGNSRIPAYPSNVTINDQVPLCTHCYETASQPITWGGYAGQITSHHFETLSCQSQKASRPAVLALLRVRQELEPEESNWRGQALCPVYGIQGQGYCICQTAGGDVGYFSVWFWHVFIWHGNGEAGHKLMGQRPLVPGTDQLELVSRGDNGGWQLSRRGHEGVVRVFHPEWVQAPKCRMAGRDNWLQILIGFLRIPSDWGF